jgi:hypothetical protein
VGVAAGPRRLPHCLRARRRADRQLGKQLQSVRGNLPGGDAAHDWRSAAAPRDECRAPAGAQAGGNFARRPHN